MSILERLRERLADRYVIERELGRGGMGAVYLARDIRLDRYVALKVLPPEFAEDSGLRERFLRETRTAASFSHPNIVPVYAIEEADDLLAFVMGYVEGESLADRVRRSGPLSVRETVKLLQDVAYALAYAHGRGVVHRDIKPDNVMIERATGRALVMDFGVARAISAPSAAAGLTRVGEVVGTPEYMSPEQATGDAVDGRSDLYSLGLTAYFALTGRAAMTADSVGKVFVRQITESLPSMASVRSDLPAALGEAIDRCLLKEPAARFQNAEGLVEALDVAQLAEPEIPLPIRLFAQEAGSTTMTLIFGVIILYLLARSNPDNLDYLLPLIAMFGVLLARALETLSDARRLARGGFTPGDVHRGLLAVLDERERRRMELRADASVRRARRRTFMWVGAQIVVAVVLFRLALHFRKMYAPGRYATSAPGVALIFVSAILVGAAVVLLVRSPFRMPMPERLFKLTWAGPFGRAFVSLAGWGVERGGNRATATGRSTAHHQAAGGAKAARAAVPEAPASDRVAVLESRVAALERWRAESNGK